MRNAPFTSNKICVSAPARRRASPDPARAKLSRRTRGRAIGSFCDLVDEVKPMPLGFPQGACGVSLPRASSCHNQGCAAGPLPIGNNVRYLCRRAASGMQLQLAEPTDGDTIAFSPRARRTRCGRSRPTAMSPPHAITRTRKAGLPRCRRDVLKGRSRHSMSSPSTDRPLLRSSGISGAVPGQECQRLAA